MPERSCFNRAMVSGRKPRMLSAGMSDTAPTWKDPAPVAAISIRPLSVSPPAVNFKGNLA